MYLPSVDRVNKSQYFDFFDLLAYLGLPWLHPGGYKATRELVDLCRINKDSLVLDVGCGVGRTVDYISRKFCCRTIGVDVNSLMLRRARQRLRDRIWEQRIDFCRCDAQCLPFISETFDAVIAQSILLYLDVKKTLHEVRRILKPKGRVGIIEYVWIREPVPQLAEKVSSLTGLKFDVLTFDEWNDILANSGFNKSYAGMFKEETAHLTDVIQTEGVDSFEILWRYLSLDRAVRRRLDELTKVLVDSEHIGYGLYCYEKGK